MKTPNQNLPARRCRSVLEQILNVDPTTGHGVAMKPKAGPRKSHGYKSETNINAESTEIWSDSNSSHSQFIPETAKQPNEVIRKSLNNLKSNHYSVSVKALRTIVQISRFSPRLLAKSMPAVYKGTTVLLKSLRPWVARTACQAADELFMNVPSVPGAGFDDLIHVLLQKAVNSNLLLRKDASKALDSMVIHVPPDLSLNILLHARIAGYSEDVRAKAARLLACVVTIVGTDPSIFVDDQTKIRLVLAGVRFLQDECESIRYHGARLMRMLMQMENYKRIIRKKMGSAFLDKIHKIMREVKGPSDL